MTMHLGERLTDLIDGRLDPPGAAEVTRHLDSCEACRTELADLQALRTLLRSVEIPEPREALWGRLEARLAQERARVTRRRWWGRILVPSTVAAIGAAVLALAPVPQVPIDINGYVREHAHYRSLHPLADLATFTLVSTDASLRLDRQSVRP